MRIKVFELNERKVIVEVLIGCENVDCCLCGVEQSDLLSDNHASILL
jgi:hypothetical protein